MNLFIIGWKLPKEGYQKVLAELQRMTEIYPLLDPGTIWQRRNASDSLFTASIHTADQAATPRRYVTQSDTEVVFYSGLPVNSTGNFFAHDANALLSHWDQLTENLDGTYCIIRAADTPARLELLTDIIGMEQVFYFHQDDLWLISNSVRLIERICKHRALDPVGVSLALSMGSVWDNRTLLSDIRVIPGGQLWSWKEGDDEPNRTCYFKPSELARLRHKKFTKSDYKRLAADLTQTLRIIVQNFDNIKCSLTGGKDTRFVASLLINAGFPVQYYTFGKQSGTDAKIAEQIAETFDLNYKLIPITSSDVLSNWDQICRQIVLHGDGMYNIHGIASVLSSLAMHHDHLMINLGGTGGELVTGFYSVPDSDFFLNRLDSAIMQNRMLRLSRDFNGIVRQEAIELAHNCMSSFIAQHLDYGFAPIDIPDAFFLYARLRRRRGNSQRVRNQYGDFFSPFITRALVEAAFSITAVQRYTEAFHYNIIRSLLPELHRMPLDYGHWRPQRPGTNLFNSYRSKMLINRALKQIKSIFKSDSKLEKYSNKLHYGTDMFNKTKWFEANREHMREFCLDRNDSLIWDFLNRQLFEKITSPATDYAELSKYGRCIDLCCMIATLFYYESSINNNS